jgi:hypothetical protein
MVFSARRPGSTATRFSGTFEFVDDELAQRVRNLGIELDADHLEPRRRRFSALSNRRTRSSASSSTSISLSRMMRNVPDPWTGNPETAGR